MRDRIPLRLACAAWVAAMASACGSPPEPTPTTLADSFSAQVEATESVREFVRDGDELTFVGPDGNGGEAAWLVRIDSTVVEPYDDPATPLRGIVESSWYRDGEPVEFFGNMSLLPDAFLERGIGQECWALWDDAAGHWGW